MAQRHKRYPVKHFFIMDRMQKAYIFQVMLIVLGICILTLLAVVGVYYLKFKTGYFYFMTEDMNADLIRHNIWSLVLPSAGPSFIIALLLGVHIALFSSRKIAIPLYKIKKWAEFLFRGDLTYQVVMRKSDNMRELQTSCNQVSKKYLEIVQTIENMASSTEKDSEKKLEDIKEYLSKFKLN